MKKYNLKKIISIIKNSDCVSTWDNSLNKTVKLNSIIISFDIETTSTYYNNEKFAFMYIWQLCFLNHKTQEKYTCYGRKWEELRQVLNIIKAIKPTNYFIIWVHNLSYEFQFMRKELSEVWQVFAGGQRKPYRANFDNFIFRDSLVLSGMSLAKTAENLTSHKIEKLQGDLDYSLIRHCNTPLTEKELLYCEYDVIIVCYYISEQIDLYGSMAKIPLTNTGRVRQFVRNNCYYTDTNHKKSSRGKYNRYRALINSLLLDVDFYNYCRSAFSGGYTHANASYTGLEVNNVSSIDFTSSYPTVMVSEKYPMSTPTIIKVGSYEEYKQLDRENHCYIFMVSFNNLVSKVMYDNYLSENKTLQKKDCSVNNGRIFSAKQATFIITDVDMDIIEKCYTWDNIVIGKIYSMYKTYLPKSIIESIIELYEKKTVLKGIEGKEQEYLLSKGMLNSIYGMCVTSIVRDNYDYNLDWLETKGEPLEQIEKYNKDKKRFLYYPWGVYVTAYARRNLWKGILEFGDDYIYSDTDSIKCINFDKHKNYIDKYNEEITKKIKSVLEYNGMCYNIPKTKKGIKKPLGVWDFEGTYTKFKTLGAKRYIYLEGDELHITIAGLGKKAGAEYITKQKNPFEFFNNEMFIPAEHTGKMTHTYIDDCLECDIVDYLGNEEHIESKTGIHLEKCEFTLNQSEQYKNFLEKLVNGEIELLGGRTNEIL